VPNCHKIFKIELPKKITKRIFVFKKITKKEIKTEIQKNYRGKLQRKITEDSPLEELERRTRKDNQIKIPSLNRWNSLFLIPYSPFPGVELVTW